MEGGKKREGRGECVGVQGKAVFLPRRLVESKGDKKEPCFPVPDQAESQARGMYFGSSLIQSYDCPRWCIFIVRRQKQALGRNRRTCGRNVWINTKQETGGHWIGILQAAERGTDPRRPKKRLPPTILSSKGGYRYALMTHGTANTQDSLDTNAQSLPVDSKS